ncbi:phospholipase D-like domain-containing protein [Vulcanisaeta sp. JCM 16161]|uniref:phospholipase D-like domain-containing protein n=1 Tax=Vulcanisaeta sp. JCM 16161 TaxID=1295372 RepID=UPI00406D11DB
MDIKLIDICNTLIECLNRARSISGLRAFNTFNVATGFIDHEGLAYIHDYLSDAADVKILVGDLGPVPRQVYDDWREVIRVYPSLHAKFYLLGNGFVILGSSNLTYRGLEGNLELNLLVNSRDLYERLMNHYNELWRKAKPLTEEYVSDVEEVEIRVSKHRRDIVDEVNGKLAEILNIGDDCLKDYNPLKCAVQVTGAINERFRGCGDLPENCLANTVANMVANSPRELARLLMGSPGSVILAGHPLCWVKSFINALRAGRINVDELDSGIRIYEYMVKLASVKCQGKARELAEEELKRLSDESYRDNYVRWKIPYRLLPLTLTLPIIDCRLIGERRADGRILRRLACNGNPA